MNKQPISSFLLFLGILFCAGSYPSHAQTLRFEMDVQPELSIEVLQNLNFGTVVAESGTSRIELGDVNMGVFEIRALATQRALLTLDPPKNLSMDQNGSRAAIPILINAVYSNRSYTAGDLTHFENNQAWISLQPDGTGRGTETAWETGYVYITGEIEVGDIPAGNYSGTLVLSVEYQ